MGVIVQYIEYQTFSIKSVNEETKMKKLILGFLFLYTQGISVMLFFSHLVGRSTLSIIMHKFWLAVVLTKR